MAPSRLVVHDLKLVVLLFSAFWEVPENDQKKSFFLEMVRAPSGGLGDPPGALRGAPRDDFGYQIRSLEASFFVTFRASIFEPIFRSIFLYFSIYFLFRFSIIFDPDFEEPDHHDILKIYSREPLPHFSRFPQKTSENA